MQVFVWKLEKKGQFGYNPSFAYRGCGRDVCTPGKRKIWLIKK